MKKQNFFMALVVLFATLLIGCDPVQPVENLTIKVKVLSASQEGSESSVPTVLFSGDEIVSYNVATGEIVFANTPTGEPYQILSQYCNGNLEFYLGDELLFVLQNRVSEIQSDVYDHPVLRYSYDTGNNGDDNGGNTEPNDSTDMAPAYTPASGATPHHWFIEDGYPFGNPLTATTESTSVYTSDRQANASAIMENFTRFVQALRAAGKVIE